MRKELPASMPVRWFAAGGPVVVRSGHFGVCVDARSVDHDVTKAMGGAGFGPAGTG